MTCEGDTLVMYFAPRKRIMGLFFLKIESYSDFSSKLVLVQKQVKITED